MKQAIVALSMFLVCAAAQGAMPPVPGDPLTGTGQVQRRVLTAAQLLNGRSLGSPAGESAFQLPSNGAHPEHRFEGRLELVGEASRGGLRVLRNDFGYSSQAIEHLPEFNFEMIQHGSHLIPARRGLIITEHPFWNYFIEPGRVWRENADGPWSRASFPFALVQKNQACTFNGVMTFLFNNAGISHVWYQITQETCFYLKANLWGMLDAVYHPEPVAGANRVRVQYVRETLQKFPSAPLAQLAQDYPGVDVSSFGAGLTRAHVTGYGVVFNNVVYKGPCRTRYGNYAYCDSMRAPSYSTAKSVYASLAMMRLAQKYGLQVPNLRVADYVEETASSAGDWSNVTFGNTLDMATGNYIDPAPWADEDNHHGVFYSARTYAEKMAAALTAPHQAPPGTRWVYRSGDTFILGRAMQNLLRSRGEHRDLFNLIAAEVYKPLKTGPGFHTTLRTSDSNWQGVPLTYVGLFWTHDDVAKITTFLNVDNGVINGRQVLHRTLLDAAMQRTPQSPGLETNTGWGRYKYGFYSQQWDSGLAADTVGPFRTQTMLGYGGIVIVLMPNGSAYYYFSDNREFAISAAVNESMLHLRPGPVNSSSDSGR